MDYEKIYAKIKLGNNGKMLLANFTKEERLILGEMKSFNLVAASTFFRYGDSVKIHPLNTTV